MPVKEASGPEKFIEKNSSNAILVKRIKKQLNFPEEDDLSDAKGAATLQPSVAFTGFGKLTENGKYGSTAFNSIVSFIWGIADDCLRDVYVRGKYRDVILPMTVIRQLGAVQEKSNPLSGV